MIHISFKNNTKRILIENSINRDKDELLLQKELLDELGNTSYEITFIDTDYIPSSIVKLLTKIDKQYLTITTTHKALWIYLSKLGIKNRLQSDHEAQSIYKTEPLKAIVIGGSAGSIEKILSLIKNIPYCDISIFIVVHILPNKVSHLRDLVQNITDYKVYEAVHNTKVDKNSIYIAPPNQHLTVVNNYLCLNDGDAVNYSRPSIDVSFKSLANEYQTSLMAILLCGYGHDGTLGLNDLKQNGCEILIEDPKECEAKEMLYNAIESKNYTKILTVQKIQKYIKAILSVEVDIQDEMESFLESIKTLYGYDFRNYDRNSLARRIELVMSQSAIHTFKEFKQTVFNSELLFEKLVNAFSINVTTFFRNPDIFKTIREEVIPTFKSASSIRIWCAGCSTGEEPYSIAILLDEMGLLEKSLIYATDSNARVLNEARNGLFSISNFKEFQQNYIKSGGRSEFEKWFGVEKSFVQVKENIKRKVLFFQHNLVSDDSINEFDLIFCRNVLIYFNSDLQKHVYDTIDTSLVKKGFLVLGESERLPKVYEYKSIDKISQKIYQKIGE